MSLRKGDIVKLRNKKYKRVEEVEFVSMWERNTGVYGYHSIVAIPLSFNDKRKEMIYHLSEFEILKV